MRLKRLMLTALVAAAPLPALAEAPGDAKPNILVIFGDDIGITNISAYGDGVVGYPSGNAGPERHARQRLCRRHDRA